MKALMLKIEERVDDKFNIESPRVELLDISPEVNGERVIPEESNESLNLND